MREGLIYKAEHPCAVRLDLPRRNGRVADATRCPSARSRSYRAGPTSPSVEGRRSQHYHTSLDSATARCASIRVWPPARRSPVLRDRRAAFHAARAPVEEDWGAWAVVAMQMRSVYVIHSGVALVGVRDSGGARSEPVCSRCELGCVAAHGSAGRLVSTTGRAAEPARHGALDPGCVPPSTQVGASGHPAWSRPRSALATTRTTRRRRTTHRASGGRTGARMRMGGGQASSQPAAGRCWAASSCAMPTREMRAKWLEALPLVESPMAPAGTRAPESWRDRSHPARANRGNIARCESVIGDARVRASRQSP
jgi:hypothetical protein